LEASQSVLAVLGREAGLVGTASLKADSRRAAGSKRTTGQVVSADLEPVVGIARTGIFIGRGGRDEWSTRVVLTKPLVATIGANVILGFGASVVNSNRIQA
jgi:hypothetical protein